MSNLRDPDAPTECSNATWGWIAGISVVVLVLIFAFAMSGEREQAKAPAPTCKLVEVRNGVYRLHGNGCVNNLLYAEALADFVGKDSTFRLEHLGNRTFIVRHQ